MSPTPEKYRCPDPRCRAEVLIALPPQPEPVPGPRCSCGTALVRGWARPVWVPSTGRRVPQRTH